MVIGNINAKIVNRMKMMCVVDSLNQHPFMAACLLNAVSLRGNTCIAVFCKFNMTGASGVRSPPAWTNYFYVFSCHSWSCVLYISVTDGVCTGQCFLTEICSDTQLMETYRDISLEGGFLPYGTTCPKGQCYKMSSSYRSRNL